MVFGRTRNLAALPWTTETMSEEARDFFERMAKVDVEVARARQEAHERLARKTNRERRSRPPYKVGDYVFLRRPRSVGGVKISTWWLGPYEVIARVGQHSYKLKVPREGLVDAHATQLKICHWVQPSVELRVPPRQATEPHLHQPILGSSRDDDEGDIPEGEEPHEDDDQDEDPQETGDEGAELSPSPPGNPPELAEVDEEDEVVEVGQTTSQSHRDGELAREDELPEGLQDVWAESCLND